MKMKQMIIGATAILLFASTTALGQVTQASPFNTVNNNTDYVGSSATSTNTSLQIRTNNNVPINFFANSILRMRLLPTLTGQTIGTYTNENLSGNVGIGAFGNGIVNRPFSLLHLDNGGTQFSGYRPWFRPGMTITNDSDPSVDRPEARRRRC